MNEQIVFISHTSSDKDKADAIVTALEKAGVSVMIDSNHLKPGGNFINFMENALHQSDYFLLLWSRAAASGKFVKAEWQAALAKEIRAERIFLLVGRLEEFPPPVLLQSRIYVDLFPVIKPGIQRLTEMWKKDRSASGKTKKIVLPPAEPPGTPVDWQHDSEEIYCSSDLFDCTLPISINLDKPAGVVMDNVLNQLSLPKELTIQGRVGIHLSYRLIFNNTPLDRRRSLGEQGVRGGSVIYLEIAVRDFSRVPPQSVAASGARHYRSSGNEHDLLLNKLTVLGLRKGYL